MNQGPDCLFLRAAEVPPELNWLGAAEKDHLAGLPVANRRADWLLGRWTAKQALIWTLETPLEQHQLARFEILPKSTGAPEVLLDGVVQPIALSLSHRGGAGLCALARTGSVGCDLEWIEERSRGFVEDYFTPSERVLIEGRGAEMRALMANVLWSAKESVLKLLGLGLSVDTRSLTVSSLPAARTGGWQPFTVAHHPDSREFAGWWRRQDNWVLTVSTEPPSGSPAEVERPEPRRGKVPAS